MDPETKERFFKAVTNAWLAGDQTRLRSLCSEHHVTVEVNPEDKTRVLSPSSDHGPIRVRIDAAPSSHLYDPIEVTVVKNTDA
jgi:hypothetical protein